MKLNNSNIYRRTVLKSGAIAFLGSSVLNMIQPAKAYSSILYSDTETGEISEESPMAGQSDPFDGHYEPYSFEVGSGEELYVELTPEEPNRDNAELYLFDPEGSLVRQDNTAGQNEPAGPEGRAFLRYSVDDREDGGTFTVAATLQNSSSDADALPNEYRLRVDEWLPEDAQIEYGDKVTEELSTDSRTGVLRGNSRLFDSYTFEVESGEELYVELTPEEPDRDNAELYLFDPEGSFVHLDNTAGQNEPAGPEGRAFLRYSVDDREDGGTFTVAASFI